MSIIIAMSVAGALNTKQIKEADMDDLLDLGFDQFEELPEFIIPAPGYASLNVKNIEDVEANNDEGLRTIRVTLAINNYLEIGNEKMVETGKATVEPGGIFSVTYQQGAGLQRLVADWKGVAQVLGANSIKDLLSKLENAEIQAEVILRASKKKDDVSGEIRYFPSLRNITLASA